MTQMKVEEKKMSQRIAAIKQQLKVENRIAQRQLLLKELWKLTQQKTK